MRKRLILLLNRPRTSIIDVLAIPRQGFCRSGEGAFGNRLMLTVAASL